MKPAPCRDQKVHRQVPIHISRISLFTELGRERLGLPEIQPFGLLAGRVRRAEGKW